MTIASVDNRAEARDALYACDPSCGREEWVTLAMAAKDAGLDLEDFDSWSAKSESSYGGPRDTRAVWNGIKPGGGVGAATLFKAARQAGWSPDRTNGHSHTTRKSRPAVGPKHAAPAPRGPASTASDHWARFEPASDQQPHPYIVVKAGTATGLRVVPATDALCINGVSVAGWLAIPAHSLVDGELTTLQFVPPPGAGKKLNLPGQMGTGAFTVGEIEPYGTVFLCEGIGQAWACWKATGRAAVACLGWGRVRSLITVLRSRHPSARLVLVPDVGKEADADKIAAEVAGCQVVKMPDGWPQNADVNDLAQRDGFDVLEQLLADGADAPGPACDDGFSTWPDGRIDAYFDNAPPPVPWFAHQRLLAGRGHVLAGVGGSSKTRAMYHLGVGAVLGALPWSWKVDAVGSAALFLTEDVAAQVHRVLHQMGQRLKPAERAALAHGLRVYPLAGRRALLLELNGNALHESRVYDWLMRQIDALPKPVSFVGIDPALGITEGNEMEAAHQRRLGELIDRIGIESGACAMLAAHATKGIHQLEELGSHTSRGSGAITDAVRGEFVMRNMTADEARRFGILDLADRKQYLQLAATKGNELPPEAYVPVWLKRTAGGALEEVSLEQVERGSVNDRERGALTLLAKAHESGETTMKFWREQCISAGLISSSLAPYAQEKAMSRIRNALRDAGVIVPGRIRGNWVPSE